MVWTCQGNGAALTGTTGVGFVRCRQVCSRKDRYRMFVTLG